jgi:hypothetical protein
MLTINLVHLHTSNYSKFRSLRNRESFTIIIIVKIVIKNSSLFSNLPAFRLSVIHLVEYTAPFKKETMLVFIYVGLS